MRLPHIILYSNHGNKSSILGVQCREPPKSPHQLLIAATTSGPESIQGAVEATVVLVRGKTIYQHLIFS